jgi:polar amino acid transport system permease protein
MRTEPRRINDKTRGVDMPFSVILEKMSVGMGRASLIFVLTLVLSLPLGVLVALARMSKNRLVSALTRIYISVMRGTPLMLQLIAVYFGPFYLFGISIRGFRFYAVIIGFVVNYAAYFAEIFRSGIESMPLGQYEAASVLGYTRGQTFLRIILPQVIKRILPSVTNEVVTLVKDTSLAFSLAYQEVFSIAKQIAASQTSFVPFMVAGVFYYIFNAIVAFGMERIEKKLRYYR